MQEFLDRQKSNADAANAEAERLDRISETIEAIARDVAEHAAAGVEEQIRNGALEQSIAQALARGAARTVNLEGENTPEKILTLAVGALLKSQVHRISGYITERARDARVQATTRRGERDAILRICDDIAKNESAAQ